MIRFWAKTGASSGEYLPIENHLLDTGAVAQKLFDISLTVRQRTWIADDFGTSVERVRAIVAFLAAAHDIGKVGPFQHCVPELAERLGSVELPGFLGQSCRHDRVSGYVLHRYVEDRGGSRDLADSLAAAVCGHHSVPAAIAGSERRGQLRALARWWEHQRGLLERVAGEFELGSFEDLSAPGHGVTLALAGLVNVSDWNASDAGRFPVTDGERPPSSRLVDDAIADAAWRPIPVAGGASFAQTFGFAPRGAQVALVELLDCAELPALILIEDRTGSGKTEAALWVARRALETGARGFYVGLPTRATADQFHDRAMSFLDRVWPARPHDLKLLHGGANLRDEADPEPTGLGVDDASDELAAARAWFDGARRGLLSPYAVGTIDQALLAVLRTRFYPVRLWGLAGKVVVVDEAHAYDTYTATLLDGLLRWLGALDCTVVVLSATLPSERRTSLSVSYRAGLLGGSPSASMAPDGGIGYPRVTLVNRTTARTVPVADPRPGRTIALEQLASADDTRGVVNAVVAAAQDGGCVALVCSTVRLAQERFAALRGARAEIDTILLHARVRPHERAPIEAALARRLGPQAVGDARPDRLVVVATQVVEQSLDLDFDVMFTDLAPVDLLVQRAGRVHRHERATRPLRHAQARLIVLDAAGGQDVHRALPAGAGAVYVDAVLLRTRAVLRGRRAIEEPADLDDLIAQVYDSGLPAGLDDDEHAATVDADRRAREQAARHRAWAQENGIGVPGGDDPPWSAGSQAIEDGDAPGAGPTYSAVTRWSERPSVNVVVLRADEAALATGPLERTKVRALLRRAVGISDHRVTGPILADIDEWRPASWRAHGALQHHALVVADGTRPVGIDWHPELGVTL